MTIGIFVPLLAAIGALLEIVFFMRMRSRLPGRMDPGYSQDVEAKKTTYTIIVGAALVVPVLLYFILNYATDTGSIVLF